MENVLLVQHPFVGVRCTPIRHVFGFRLGKSCDRVGKEKDSYSLYIVITTNLNT